ncbi:MAG: hypothetical protein J6S85_05980 [Methanobrevibacter sp.]|nr:hypothetical protein [Methanobrevibacter sp.]
MNLNLIFKTFQKQIIVNFFTVYKKMENIKVKVCVTYPGWSDFTKHQERFESSLSRNFPDNKIICFYYHAYGGWCPPQYVEYEIEIPLIKNDVTTTKHLFEDIVKTLRGETSSITYF